MTASAPITLVPTLAVVLATLAVVLARLAVVITAVVVFAHESPLIIAGALLAAAELATTTIFISPLVVPPLVVPPMLAIFIPAAIELASHVNLLLTLGIVIASGSLPHDDPDSPSRVAGSFRVRRSRVPTA
jgi:hypothetical protein